MYFIADNGKTVEREHSAIWRATLGYGAELLIYRDDDILWFNTSGNLHSIYVTKGGIHSLCWHLERVSNGLKCTEFLCSGVKTAIEADERNLNISFMDINMRSSYILNVEYIPALIEFLRSEMKGMRE